MTEDTTETDVLTGRATGESADDDGTDPPADAGADGPAGAGTDGPADAGADPPARDAGRPRMPGDRDATTYPYWAVLAALGLLGLLALFRFYDSTSRAISIWVAPEFEPVLQAAFNLVVLLVAAVGISLVVRELAE